MQGSVVACTLAGLFLSLGLNFTFILLARSLCREFWAFAYIAIIFTTSSILCLQVFGHRAWILFILSFFYLVLLVLGRVKRNAKVLLYSKPTPKERFLSLLREFLGFNCQEKWILGLNSSGLLLCILYSALPIYRPDQWDYHLSVSKLISSHGSLNLPIYNDHIFFSGVYEYFFTLPRLVLSNDVIMQALSDSFSFFAFLVLVYASWSILKEPEQIKERWQGLNCVSFFAFSVPAQNMAMNAKVEPLLLGTACLILSTLIRIEKQGRKSGWKEGFFLGFLILAPLAAKVIWLHFILACLPMGALIIWRHRQSLSKPFLLGFLGGVFAASLVLIPYLMKNIYFFGNPFHPIQGGPFQSVRWSLEMAEYWKHISGRAYSLQAYVETLARTPWTVLKATIFLFMGGLFIFFVSDKKRFVYSHARIFLSLLSFAIVSLFIWPLFFRHDIYPRFYYPLLSLFFVSLVLLLKEARLGKFGSLALVIPLLFNSSLEVKGSMLAKSFSQTIEEFYRYGAKPLPEFLALQTLNQHRRLVLNSSRVSEGVVMADIPRGYFFDGIFVELGGMDFNWHEERLKDKLGRVPCVWEMLSNLGVNYLFLSSTSASHWGDDFTSVFTQAEKIGEGNNIYFISNQLIDDNLQKCYVEASGAI